MNQFARPGLAVTELPSFNEDDKGKVLKINESSGVLGWEQQDDPLPPVTSADNGKVLAVKDGAWAADSNLFVVTVSRNAQYVYTADKTYAEIMSAINAGKPVICYNSVIKKYYNLSYADDSYVEFYYPTTNNQATAICIATGTNTVTLEKYLSLPKVAAANNGSELIVKDGAWAMQQKKFIVTLTPTALDYSGTMDKTVAEINAAYEAGQEIVFRFVIDQDAHADVAVTAVNYDAYTYPSFDAFAIMLSANVLVYAYTSYTNDGTKQTYSTVVYSLTPAS